MEDRIKVKLVEIKEETYEVNTFRLKPLGNTSIEYLPGQFIFLYVKMQKGNKEIEVRRSYSIASSPTEKGYIELTIKKVSGGLVSTYLHEDVKTDDVFEVSSAMGKFTYGEEIKKIALVSAGSGIVPMRSIMKYCTDKNLDTKICLLHSAKTGKDIIYMGEFEEMAKQNKNITLVYTVTRDETWGGLKGRISRELVEASVPEIASTVFYLCGPLEFIRSVASILSGLGVDRANIKRDVWA